VGYYSYNSEEIVLIEQALLTELVTVTGLTDLINDKLYYVKALQDVEEPYVVFFKVSATREHTLDGAAGLATARFQFSIFSTTYQEAKQIAGYIQLALQGMNKVIGGAGGIYANILYDNEQDLTEDEVYHIAQEFIVMHNE
jgi:hypothetical protein